MIEFHLDGRSGVAPYLQLIHQVRHALRLGLLHRGDQLPNARLITFGENEGHLAGYHREGEILDELLARG